MTSALGHRGPDDCGIESLTLNGYQVCLGHRRLSILDLSANGHQPMTDGPSGSWVTFNGEIYNHLELRAELPNVPFRSTSDTETLLRGWVAQGPEWIRRLRGMFAFALLDGQRQELWLARDHVGIKPLYVSHPEQDLWLFASEVRALLASGMVPRRISPAGLASYLNFGAVQAPWTLIENVDSLLPGERLRFSLRDPPAGAPRGEMAVEASRYWSRADHFAPRAEGPGRARRGEVAAADWGPLREAWDYAVGSRMLSDVPVGVFLSGGIDSSAIVATLTRLGHTPRTFSIGFSEPGFDESEHAQLVARQYRTEHRRIELSPTRVLSQFDTIVAAYDQPSIDGANTFMISQAVREAGIKVAISGLGGDELFAGYPSFRRLAFIDRWAPVAPETLRRLAAALLAGCAWGKSARTAAILRNASSRLDVYFCLRELFSAADRRELLGTWDADSPLEAGLAAETARQAQAADAVNAVSLLEMGLYMQNMLLRDTDQMSMAHALEVRVPLLDHVLIERAAGLGGICKLPSDGQPDKWLPIALAGNSLPREVFDRRKMGFAFPWDAWLRNELRGRVSEILADRPAVERTGLQPQAAAALWRRFLAEKSSVRPSEVLGIVHLVDWAERNTVGPPVKG